MALTIPIVLDTTNNEHIPVDMLDELYEQHELQNIRFNNTQLKRFVCGNCSQLVYLHSKENKASQLGHSYYFQHPSGIECEWKSDGKSQALIYAGVKEGKKHREMKLMLEETLISLDGWEIIDVDKKFVFSLDKLQRAKPDLHAQYLGEDIAFEVQLRSESPEVIKRRQEFYYAKGWKLIWLSAENSEIVSENFKFDCLDVKQVQKDIAFSNRGNWFIFNKELSEKSIKEGKLTIQAKTWEVTRRGCKLSYGWSDEIISYSDLRFSGGDTFYKDFYQLDQQMKKILRDEGMSNIVNKLPLWHENHWYKFLLQAKKAWPSLDSEVDNDWLHEQFTEDMQKRELIIKEKIVTFFRNSIWRIDQNRNFWDELANKTEELNFGIQINADLRTVEKLLLILGYDLSLYLNRAKQAHAQATHYFFDCESFLKYQEVCLSTVKVSKYRIEILNNKKVERRLRERKPLTEQSTDLNRFVEWFTTEPIPTNYDLK